MAGSPFVGGGGVTVHNELTGRQGGAASESFHLTSAQHGFASVMNQNVRTTDNVTFNSITTTATTSQFNGLTSTGQLLVNRNNVNSIVAQGTGEQLIVRARVSGGNTFMAFKTFDNIRRGFFGFGGSGSNAMNVTNQTSDGTLHFSTNNTPRMHIAVDGNVGIGTTSPVANTVAGVKLLAIGNATTIPTGTVTSAGILYTSNGQLHNLDAAGTDHNLTSTSALLISTADVVVGNTTTETSLLGAGTGTKAIPATRMVVGAKFKIKAQGFLSTVANANANFRFKIGGLEKAATGSKQLGNFSNEHFEVDIEMVIRTEGTSGTAVVSGKFIDQMGDHFGIVNMGTIAINTTVTANFDLTVQWAVMAVGSTITSQIAEIEVINV